MSSLAKRLIIFFFMKCGVIIYAFCRMNENISEECRHSGAPELEKLRRPQSDGDFKPRLALIILKSDLELKIESAALCK